MSNATLEYIKECGRRLASQGYGPTACPECGQARTVAFMFDTDGNFGDCCTTEECQRRYIIVIRKEQPRR